MKTSSNRTNLKSNTFLLFTCISVIAIWLFSSQIVMAEPQRAGCSKDSDCKGVRVCEQMICVNPNTKNSGNSAAKKSNPCGKFYVGQMVQQSANSNDYPGIVIGIGNGDVTVRTEGHSSVAGAVNVYTCENAASGTWTTSRWSR